MSSLADLPPQSQNEIKSYMAKFATMSPEQRRRHMAVIAAWIIRIAEEKVAAQ